MKTRLTNATCTSASAGNRRQGKSPTESLTCVAKRFRGPDDRRGTAIAAGVSSADRPPRMTAVYTLRHAPGSAYLLVHQIQRECGAAHLALNHHDEMPTLVDPMDLSA